MAKEKTPVTSPETTLARTEEYKKIVTPAQIAEWKAKYGDDKIFEIAIAHGEAELVAIMRKATLRDLEAATTVSNKTKKPMEFVKSIFSTCKLFCDAEIVSVDENYQAAIAKLDEVTEIKEASIKKL